MTTAKAGDANQNNDATVPIGGFFERHEPDGAQRGPSLLAAWTQGRPHAAFVNARSAVAALVASRPGCSVWLPAFLCHDLVQPAYCDQIRFYPVRPGFEPDLAPVVAQARPGDLVLVAAYFGLPISAEAIHILGRRPDLCVVEDRAQALDAGPGDGLRAWRLYSPRKLLGVADGGLLVAPDPTTAPPQPASAADSQALWAAPNMRSKDPLGQRNSVWHGVNQAKEAAMAVGSQAMTEPSRQILSRTSLASLSTPRLRNWRALEERLSAWSVLPHDPQAPPLGYVLRLEPDVRERLLKGLHEQRIFAAIHWPQIAGPPADFPTEAAWTSELITLPCDHRYGEVEMVRIAKAVTDLLP